MELLKQLITRILGSGLLSTALVLVRAVTVLMDFVRYLALLYLV